MTTELQKFHQSRRKIRKRTKQISRDRGKRGENQKQRNTEIKRQRLLGPCPQDGSLLCGTAAGQSSCLYPAASARLVGPQEEFKS